jgi:peptide/nickel transport system substrate-binding protein
MMRLGFLRYLACAVILAGLSATTGVAAEEPRRGGTFVWGMSSEMNILDPHATCSWYTTNAIHNMFEGLVMLDLSDPDAKAAKLRPAIAKSWSQSDDGTVYTFQIRENVKFHDGKSVDADVVKWNYDRFFDNTQPQFFEPAFAVMRYYTRWIKSVEVTGAMEVTITLNQPNYEWLQFGVQSCGMPMIISPTQVETTTNEGFSLAPIGTGPFQFVEREQNIKVVFERFDGYWGKKANIDRLIFRPLPDPATRLSAMRAGEVHMINEAPWAELDGLQEEGFVLSTNENIPSIWLLFFNHRDPVMSDVRVRKAINMAINREGIAHEILRDTGRAEQGMLSPGTFAYEPGFVAAPYDPEAARALLVEAGHGEGLAIEFDIYEYGYNEAWEKWIQRDLKKIGIDVKLNKIEWITYLGKLAQGMPEGLQMNEIAWGWSVPYWTQVVSRCDSQPPYGFNIGWYSNPEVDKLFDQALAEKDKAKSAALYRQANEIIMGKDFAYAPKFVYYNPLVLDPKVKGFVNPPENWYDFSLLWFEE